MPSKKKRKLVSISQFMLFSDNHIFNFLYKELRKFGNVETDDEHYLYLRREDSEYLLNAHFDTVADGSFKYLSVADSKLSNLNGVLGADDRAGCFMIYDLLNNKELPPFDILFTNYEESGGAGVKAFLEDDIFDYGRLKAFIGLDRRGAKHYVAYQDLAPEIKEYLKSFGLTSKYGSTSDIRKLTDALKIPSFNLAVGYYNEHTAREYLDLQEFRDAITTVRKILQRPMAQRYEVPKKKEYKKYTTTPYWGTYGTSSWEAEEKKFRAKWEYDEEQKRWVERDEETETEAEKKAKITAIAKDVFAAPMECRSCARRYFDNECYTCKHYEDLVAYDESHGFCLTLYAGNYY